ncbi:MAG: hypothetical protein OHK0046_21320 [Anaerolineae bacterium]
MNPSESLVNLQMPSRVWIELHSGDPDARDVLVQMEDGTLYTSVFVTLSYLSRQMKFTRELCEQIPDTIPTSFAVLDTPHLILGSLDREMIEDTIDNLLAMEIFESVFVRVTETEDETTTTTNGNGRRATQEVAAVVLSDVLVVEE